MQRRTVDLPRTDHLEVDDAKQLLRETLRSHRSRRPAGERTKAGMDIARRLLPLLDGAGTVALYVSRETEPPSLPAIEALSETGIRILLPALGPGLARAWAEYAGTEDLEERAPGRPAEPSGERLPSETIAEADVVVIPALAVDTDGNRLGQGGGWYDRVLKLLPDGAPIWAVLFDDELVEGPLPSGPQDVLVGGVVQPGGTTVLGSAPAPWPNPVEDPSRSDLRTGT